jgi:phage terminase large subunit
MGALVDEMALLPAQADFVTAEERFVAFVGGVGSGKTVAGAVKAIRYAQEHAGAVGVVGAPNRTMLRDVLLPTLLELLPDEVRRSYKQTEGKITFPNGSVILARSLEDFDHRRGLNLAFFWLDEGIYCGFAAWRVMKARLRQLGYPVQGWLTSTPRGQDEFYRDFERDPALNHRLIRAATRDNTYLPADYADSLGYTGSFALQELEGQFVAREGLVFHLLPEHVAPAPPAEEMEEVFGGIDWGYTNPFHLSVVGMRDGVAYLLAEHRATRASLDRGILPAIEDLTRTYGVTAWYGGTDRPENIAAAQEWLRQKELRCTVTQADNAVLAGIDTTRSLLEHAPVGLIIDPACVHTIREFNEYHYEDAGVPGPDAPSVAAERPHKSDDHAIDALRYALHTRLGPERQRRRGARFLAQLRRRREAYDSG